MVGKFLHIDGQSRSSLAAVDLTSYALTSWAPHRFCSGCDTDWDVATDGTWAYVGASGAGGNFTAFNLVTGQQRWPYVHADGDVQAVYLAGDGKAYLGGHFGTSIYNVATSRTVVPVTVLAAVDVATGQPDPTFTPKIFKHYPGCWTFTSTPGKLWAGGDFTGEQANGAEQPQALPRRLSRRLNAARPARRSGAPWRLAPPAHVRRRGGDHGRHRAGVRRHRRTRRTARRL